LLKKERRHEKRLVVEGNLKKNEKTAQAHNTAMKMCLTNVI
jgi:hypothetical protein